MAAHLSAEGGGGGGAAAAAALASDNPRTGGDDTLPATIAGPHGSPLAAEPRTYDGFHSSPRALSGTAHQRLGTRDPVTASGLCSGYRAHAPAMPLGGGSRIQSVYGAMHSSPAVVGQTAAIPEVAASPVATSVQAAAVAGCVQSHHAEGSMYGAMHGATTGLAVPVLREASARSLGEHHEPVAPFDFDADLAQLESGNAAEDELGSLEEAPRSESRHDGGGVGGGVGAGAGAASYQSVYGALHTTGRPEQG